MVKLIAADKVKKEARIMVTKNDAIDICTALIQMYGHAEEAVIKFGTEQDKQEAVRLKECMNGMQKIKNSLM